MRVIERITALFWKAAENVLGPLGALFADRDRRDAAERPGEKIRILLARLAGDTPTDVYRTTVFETIREQLGDAVELIVWPDAFAFDGSTARHAQVEAQVLLKQQHCDLLLTGRVKGDNARGPVLSLRFTVAAAEHSPESDRPVETLDLPAMIVGQLGAAISAWVMLSAAPAFAMAGRFILPQMRAAAARIEPILLQPNAAFDAETRGALLHGYAVIRATIGEQAGSNDDLAAAAAAFRETLKVWTRERVPFQWSATQNNLGCVLRKLGEREGGTALLDEAITAFHEALKERPRERLPLDWAATQDNLANTLLTLGVREDSIASLEEAVACYREALKERTRARVPLDWAATQNNLGNVLQTLGERDYGTARLEQAVATYREALKEWTRERVPLDWARSQHNLGNALHTLGERGRESDTANLGAAIAAFREALKERTRERVPLDWALTHKSLGSALITLGEREGGTAPLDEAIAVLKAALSVFESAKTAHYVEGARQNLTRAEALIAARRSRRN